MKRNYTVLACLFAILFSFRTSATAETETFLISFMKAQVSQGTTNISGEYVYNTLLTDSSKEWIDSIKCDHVNTRTKVANSAENIGLFLYPHSKDNNYQASLTLYFNPEKLISAKQITVYTAPYGPVENWSKTRDINLDLFCNGTKIENMPNLPNPVSRTKTLKPTGKEDLNTLVKAIDENNAASLAWISPDLNLSEPLKTIELLAYRVNSNWYFDEEEVYAVEIAYDKDFKVAVNEIEEDNATHPVEYYDIMGRKLNSVPQTGLYIRKNGSKVQKLIAH